MKPYVVHHLLQDLPGYRKLKVLEERSPSQSECLRPGRSQRWGWACQAQSLIRGLRLALLSLWRSCIWKGALGRSSLLVLIEIGTFRCLSELGPEIPALWPSPPMEMGAKFPTPPAAWIFTEFSPTKSSEKKTWLRICSLRTFFFSSQTSQTRSKPNTVWRSVCELEQTWPSLQFLTKPQSSSASPGSRLGFAQLLGSKQPKPVGFNCYRRRSPCSGT